MTSPAAPVPKETTSPRRSVGQSLWTHRWLVGLTILAVGAGGWYAITKFVGPSVAVDRAVRGLIVETVVASGNVETPFRVNIASRVAGAVKTVAVAEGANVVQGQVLISLDDQELKANVSQATFALAQARDRAAQLDSQTLPAAIAAQAEAQATLLNARQTFDRTAALTAKGYATRQAQDDAQKAVDVAIAQLRGQDLTVASASPGGSDRTVAEGALRQAGAALATAQAQLGYAQIVAPRGGVLMSRNVENGTVVQPGVTLLVLAPAGATQLSIAIDERNLGKLAIGQTAVASADAYPDRRFPAVVSYINPGVDIARGSVEVKLDVASPPAFLLQDMTVSVDVEVARSADALSLPGRAVHDSLTAAPWVMGVQDGRAIKIPVVLGLLGATATEIKSGLAEGDAAIPVAVAVVVGQRVRAAAAQ